ncbi:hypothetical protein KKA14_01655, partial [bacterium]|nr:hypothetical protein [bacterium]
PPTPDASSTLYHNTLEDAPDGFNNGETIQIIASEGETKIYQIKYNLIYGDTQSSTSPYNITDGTADKESSLVLIIDKDNPRLTVLPPSSGTLSSSLAVMPFLQDQGIDMMNAYKSTNSTLADSTADDSASAKYCKVFSDDVYENTSVFWDNCASYNTIPSGTTIQNITTNTYIALTGLDEAGNISDCDVTYQFTCDTANAGYYEYEKHLVEYYTPGIQLSEIYHDSDIFHTVTENTNFGHAVAIGNLDGGATNNDIVIGAPAYSYISGTTTSKARGAVYIWYNGFRERATKRFAMGDATMDVSGKWLEFKTDGGTALKIELDPSNDVSGLAKSSDYSDKTQATADEIANYLNRAFLSSFGTNGNHLFALPTDTTGDIYTSDSTGDGYVTIGHINRTIGGYFSITSSNNFDASSDFNYGGGAEKTIRAYDYAIFGENDDDEFGYSVAIDRVDTSPDSSYSSKHVIVGAPGYALGKGALYIVQVPLSDASADYSQIKLESGEDGIYGNAYRIEATLEGRLGTALAFHDKTGDGTKEIYVSAPYFDGGATNGGAVYQMGKDFVFDSTSDTTTDVSDGSTVTDSVSGTVVNGLFGYSMIAGKTKLYPTTHLYVGSPGREKASDVLGSVKVYDIGSAAGNFLTNYRVEKTENGGIKGNLYGFSLAIIGNSFDASDGTKCPCLLVGSPGSQSERGRVYILGDVYGSYIDGSSDVNGDGDKLGISIVTSGFTTLLDSNSNTDIIFIGTRNNHKGRVTVLYKQSLQNDVALTKYSGLRLTPTGNTLGDNLGNSMAILHLADGTKALITGLAGEHVESVSSTSIYRMGNKYYRKGGVRIYSFNRLGF